MSDPITRLTAALEGRYRIERELGEGGMATVYLADDLRHERKVALKVLKPELAAVVGAERFLAEIKTTANLQHPHILPLFDSGEADGFLYYVMPYVEGESLRERLEREKQLPVDDALRIAADVAEALGHAHRQGVVHRDIKPANVLLRDGRAVVADFGIALAVQQAGGGRLTETGLSLGTPYYMSPEQASADRDTDARSDVYSLACVTYEMLSGDPPHTASTAQAVLAKILTEKPRSLREARDTVPDQVAWAIGRALEKLPADRFGSADDFRRALTGEIPMERPITRAGAAPGPRGRVPAATIVPWVVAASSAAAMVTMMVVGPAAGTDTEPRWWNLALETPMVFVGEGSFGAGFTALDISPDGSRIVYVGEGNGTTRLFVRSTDGPQAGIPLPGTEGAFAPFFSPDGREIAFFADDQLKRVSVDGGSVSVVTEAPDSHGGSWGEGGLALSVLDGKETLVVRSNGLDRRVVQGELGGGTSRWLPGGRWVLDRCSTVFLCVMSVEDGESFYLTLDGGAVGSPDEGPALRGFDARYLPNGYLLYGSPGQNEALAVRFDAESLETVGQPAPVLTGLRREGLTGALHVAVSDDGSLVYAQGIDAAEGELVWVDASGREELLPFEPQVFGAFSLSPDGRRVAAPVTTAGGVARLWLLDLETGLQRFWSGDASPVVAGAWDSTSQSTYVNTSDALNRLIRVEAETLAETVVYEGSETLTVHRVLPDGRLLLQRVSADGDVWLVDERDLELVNTIEAAGERAVELPGVEGFPAISPDGRWLTYSAMVGDRSEIYAVPFPVPDSPRPRTISRTGGEEGVWSPQGDGLYFRDGQRWYRVPYNGSADQPFGEPELFAEGEYLNMPGLEYAVAPEGDRILVVRSLGEPTTSTLNVITNWFEVMEAQVVAGNR